MQACHALGYVERQLKSIIKHSGYAIQPVYIRTMCMWTIISREK